MISIFLMFLCIFLITLLYLIIHDKISLTVLGFQRFLSRTHNLRTVVWIPVLLSKSENSSQHVLSNN